MKKSRFQQPKGGFRDKEFPLLVKQKCFGHERDGHVHVHEETIDAFEQFLSSGESCYAKFSVAKTIQTVITSLTMPGDDTSTQQYSQQPHAPIAPIALISSPTTPCHTSQPQICVLGAEPTQVHPQSPSKQRRMARPRSRGTPIPAILCCRRIACHHRHPTNRATSTHHTKTIPDTDSPTYCHHYKTIQHSISTQSSHHLCHVVPHR